MADIIRIIRKGDPSTVLADFHDEAGANNAYGVRTSLSNLDLGVPEPEEFLFPRPEGGDVLTAFRLPSHPITFALQAADPNGSQVTLAKWLGEVSRILVAGGDAADAELLYQQDGGDPRYIDFLPSPPLPLFHGQGAQFTITEDGIAPDVRFIIRRQPGARGDELDPAVNLIPSNPSLLLEDATNAGRPAGWDWDDDTNISNEEIDNDAEAYAFDVATDGVVVLKATQYDAQASIAELSFAVSVFAWSDAPDAKAAVQVDWHDGAGVYLSTDAGALTTLPTSRPDRSDPSAALSAVFTAPANAHRAVVGLKIDNDDATSRRVYMTLAQLEKADAPTLWVPGELVVSNDPADPGARRYPVYVHGEAPAPGRFEIADPPRGALVGLRQGGAANGAVATLNVPAVQAEDGFLFDQGIEQQLVTDATASAGKAVLTTFADGNLKARIRFSNAWSMEERQALAFASSYAPVAVVARINIDNLTPPNPEYYDIQIRYQHSSYDAPHELPITRIATNVLNGQSGWFEVVLGVFQLEERAQFPILEVWAAAGPSENGLHNPGELYWDCFDIVPADLSGYYWNRDEHEGVVGQHLSFDSERLMVVALEGDDTSILTEGRGPIPSVVRPGVNVFAPTFVDALALPPAGDSSWRKSDLTDDHVVRYAYSPHYLA